MWIQKSCNEFQWSGLQMCFAHPCFFHFKFLFSIHFCNRFQMIDWAWDHWARERKNRKWKETNWISIFCTNTFYTYRISIVAKSWLLQIYHVLVCCRRARKKTKYGHKVTFYGLANILSTPPTHHIHINKHADWQRERARGEKIIWCIKA